MRLWQVTASGDYAKAMAVIAAESKERALELAQQIPHCSTWRFRWDKAEAEEIEWPSHEGVVALHEFGE